MATACAAGVPQAVLAVDVLRLARHRPDLCLQEPRAGLQCDADPDPLLSPAPYGKKLI